METINKKLRVGILTTSRADYSIYRPLVDALMMDKSFETTIIGVQTKTYSSYHGTFQFALEDNLPAIAIEIDDSKVGDKQIIQTEFYAEVARGLGKVLRQKSFDLIFCLGDRYEMYAACGVVTLFGVALAHLHGGEVTTGAIDEKYRHAITQISDFHFTSCEEYRQRVISMGVKEDRAFNVGALGVENLLTPPYLNIEEIKNKIGVDLGKKTVFVTYHPATAEPQNLESNLIEFTKALEKTSDQILITLGNSDVGAGSYNQAFIDLSKKDPARVFVVANLNTLLFKSVLRNCQIMLGNSSSGIIEAASFNVVVVNVGNRQLGRATSKNTISVGNTEKEILEGLNKAQELVGKKFTNVYFQENVSSKIINILKKLEFKR